MNELPDNNFEEARRWLHNVEDDLRALRHALDSEEIPGRIGCFLAHLTVEKALKAVLIDAEVPFKKTHDLEALYALCTQAGRLAGIDNAELAALNPWAIDGRYTDDLRDATRREAMRFAALAESVVAAVRAELEGS
jgi:HEPN domain-containing protein